MNKGAILFFLLIGFLFGEEFGFWKYKVGDELSSFNNYKFVGEYKNVKAISLEHNDNLIEDIEIEDIGYVFLDDKLSLVIISGYGKNNFNKLFEIFLNKYNSKIKSFNDSEIILDNGIYVLFKKKILFKDDIWFDFEIHIQDKVAFEEIKKIMSTRYLAQ